MRWPRRWWRWGREVCAWPLPAGRAGAAGWSKWEGRGTRAGVAIAGSFVLPMGRWGFWGTWARWQWEHEGTLGRQKWGISGTCGRLGLRGGGGTCNRALVRLGWACGCGCVVAAGAGTATVPRLGDAAGFLSGKGRGLGRAETGNRRYRVGEASAMWERCGTGATAGAGCRQRGGPGWTGNDRVLGWPPAIRSGSPGCG